MTRNRSDRPRVFCIGWHKTGTTTLGLALIELGYSVVGCRLDMVHPLRRGDLDTVLKTAGDYDAVQDIPWAALYRELDERYPGSRFIMTRREEAGWLNSASRHFADAYVPLHEWLYGKGVLKGHEELYLERFRRHERDVLDYFWRRQDDLLIMDLEAGDGWNELCGFLGDARPGRPFPHANKGPHSYTAKDRLLVGVRRAVPHSLRKAIFAIRQGVRDRLGWPDPRNRFNNFRQNRTELERARKRRHENESGKCEARRTRGGLSQRRAIISLSMAATLPGLLAVEFWKTRSERYRHWLLTLFMVVLGFVAVVDASGDATRHLMDVEFVYAEMSLGLFLEELWRILTFQLTETAQRTSTNI